MTICGTLTVIRVKQPINDNSWYINGNSCKKQPKTIRCSRIFSIPLRVCGKVVILQRETNLTMDDPNKSAVL